MANGQNIDYSEKRKWPKGFICPCTGVKSIIFKYVYWYMKQISGERLQDHWSSGLSKWTSLSALLIYMIHNMRTNNVVSEQIRQTPSCTSTEDGKRLEILDLESRGIVLSVQ